MVFPFSFRRGARGEVETAGEGQGCCTKKPGPSDRVKPLNPNSYKTMGLSIYRSRIFSLKMYSYFACSILDFAVIRLFCAIL